MDGRDFLIDTDFPTDLIVGVQRGSFSVPADGSMHEILVPHNLLFTPLPLAKWSTSPDFVPSYDQASELAPTPISGVFRTNATNLNVRSINFTSTSYTMYYLVIYLMPVNTNASAPFTNNDTGDFLINTDFNLSKLLPLPNILNASSGTVEHKLNYYPATDAWWELDGWVNKVDSAQFGLTDSPQVRITTNTLEFISGVSIIPTRWHYRSYAEAL